jgi:predicted NBD/HSP70 family sugar kinase
MSTGAAAGHSSFAYLQAGVKIGVGLVVNGQLVRGAGGAAGEVANLPFPWSPADTPRRGALEQYLGSAALLRRCRSHWPAEEAPPPHDAVELFARAESGSAAAMHAVRQHAEDIGRLAASVIAMLDPGLIVLGGGVGQNQLLIPEVRRTVEQLAWPTEIVTSTLGAQGTITGAARIAASNALQAMVGADREPALNGI